MKVINLYDKDFNIECIDLAKKVEKDFKADLIVGVLTGGGAVGQRIYKYISQNRPVRYCEVKVQRKGTIVKRKIDAGKYLKFIPERILNILRVLEVWILEGKKLFITPKREGDFAINQEVESFLHLGSRNILIVDDCIDTGATLKIVVDYFRDKLPNAKIKTAVITKAHKKTLITVDYLMYDRVLIRFPWSFDSKGDEE